jgi:adenosylcobinamide kinase / adenosylcobinamide-phosphate guanylyltransferase
MTATLILGGARSGKSRYAQRLALALTDRPIYLATSRPWDHEHQARIARHVRDRGPEWRTIEAPTGFGGTGLVGEVIVVDCVTLWLTNLFVDAGTDTDECLTQARAEIERALAVPNTWIFVSNEIGQGVHAETESGRRFVDLQGFVNQYLAERADAVTLMVAGIPLHVKGAPPTP